MKKIIFAACALFAMASCTQNEMEGGALHEKQEMRFSSAQIATRVAGDAWEAEDEIGIYVTINGQAYKTNVNYYTPEAGASVSFSPNIEDGGERIDYPEAEVFDVFAYHPHNPDIEKGSYTINFASQGGSNPSPRQDYEVLEASKKDLTRNGEPVKLEFSRVFSNIAVNLIAGIGFEEGEIDESWRLTLEDQIAKTIVSYNAGDEMLTLTNETEKEDIKMTYYEDNPLFRDLVVASGVSFKPAFKLEFFESGAAEETLRLVATEGITTTRGGQHIFYITVNRTPLGLVGEIAPWVDSDLDAESSDGTYMLADFAYETLIPTHDEWVIMDTDEEAMKVNYYEDGDSNALESLDFRYLYDIIEKAMVKDPSREITLIFPNLETIPVYAFNQNTADASAQIYGISAPSVTSIGEYAFSGCSKLAKVDLPQVTSIKNLAFENCTSLTEINFGYDKVAGEHAIITDIASNWTNADNDLSGVDLFIGYVQDSNVSFGDDNKTMTVDETTFTFNSITRDRAIVTTFEDIDDETLAAADKWIITNETATDDATNAKGFAALRAELQVLNATDSKISLEFPNLTKIPEDALMNSKIKSISAPNVTEVGEDAFINCDKLTSVDLPQVTSIAENAFKTCSSLETINFGYDKVAGKHAIITDISSSWTDMSDLSGVDLFIGYVQDSKVSFDDAENQIRIIVEDRYEIFTFKSITRERAVFTTLKDIATLEVNDLTSNMWFINDKDVAWDLNFKALRTKLQALNGSGREISLEFLNLTSFTNNALMFDETSPNTSLVNVSAPMATELNYQAFLGCTALVDASFPSAINVSLDAFRNCTSLKTLNIGYGETLSAEITSIDHGWFGSETVTSDITLSLGTIVGDAAAATTPTVEENVLKWVNVEPLVSQTFAAINQR